MKFWRNLLGYLLGFTIFVLLLPALMWWLAGCPQLGQLPAWRLAVLALFAVTGLGFSVYTIVYMQRVGCGNPFDFYNHEVAPRTQKLMTNGPYRASRNPMMLGVLIYYLGLDLCLLTWQPLLVLLVFLLAMTRQIRAEEKRLVADFGAEYIAYQQSTPRFFSLRRKK